MFSKQKLFSKISSESNPLQMLTLGVCGTSKKENERRIPIHPAHLKCIPNYIRENLYLEENYGVPFGITNSDIEPFVAGMLPRKTLLQKSDIVLLFKPVPEDFLILPQNGVFWGCAHFVQDKYLTQIAINSRLSAITCENMFEGRINIFRKNNEIAGYAGVLHSLQLRGLDGIYGGYNPHITVISYGSVSQGAVKALLGRGFRDITVFTKRHPNIVTDKAPGVQYAQMIVETSGKIFAQKPGEDRKPFIQEIVDSNIIINGILQDPDNPLMFVRKEEIDLLKPKALIIDISCDVNMGFAGAKPTSFEKPSFQLGEATYYAVDHTPSYLYDSASREISVALLPFLETVMRGPEAWEKNSVIRNAIDIQNGYIKNPKILSFQNRALDYPYDPIEPQDTLTLK